MDNCLEVLKLLNRATNFLAISLLGKYPRELKTYVHIKMCMLVFIVASLIIATKGRNNPNAHQLMNY